MPLYERVCPYGHTFDVLVKIDDRNNPVTCQCGEDTKLKISPVRTLFDGSDPDFHDSHSKWVKQHEDANGKPEKENISHI